MSSTRSTAPSTEMRTDCRPVSTEPAGSTLFWPAMAFWRSVSVKPRSASAFDDTSMKIFSGWSPMMTAFSTPGVVSSMSRAWIANVLSSG